MHMVLLIMNNAAKRNELQKAERELCDLMRRLADSQQYTAFAAARDERAAIRRELQLLAFESGFRSSGSWTEAEAR